MSTAKIEPTRCTALSRSGSRCRRAPILGGKVCHYHGGAAPQVRLKAEERLKAMVDPALGRLEQLSKQSKSLPAAVAATRDILDRAGVGTTRADPSRPPVVNIMFHIPRPGQPAGTSVRVSDAPPSSLDAPASPPPSLPARPPQ